MGSREKLENIMRGLPDLTGKELYIFGAGNTASLYQEGLRRLERENFVVTGYVDNKKAGGIFEGKRIISPLEIKERQNICVLICSPQPSVIKSISEQLGEMGIEFFHIDEVIFKMHAREIISVFDTLEDKLSQDTFLEVVRARMSGNYVSPDLFCENQYFALPHFRRMDSNEVFVNCGAYVGDTIEKYIWSRFGVFRKIIGFEPDRNNFNAMKKRISRLRDEWNLNKDSIELYPYALSDIKNTVSIRNAEETMGLGGKVLEGECDGAECLMISIDEVINEPISFLNADVESYEYRMLLGAKETIRNWKPNLAISIYHNAVDMFSIPLLIKELVPEYKIAVRHHSYQLYDTVLYAWCE